MIIKKCGNCDFYDTFTGACCNGFSDNRADFMNQDNSCLNWKKETEFEELESPDEN